MAEQLIHHLPHRNGTPILAKVSALTAVKTFVPKVPESLEQAGLNHRQVEALVLKFLVNAGNATGRDVATQIALPFTLMERVLYKMKADQLVVFRGATALGDYVYELTEKGTERARRDLQHSSFYGAAPVPLSDYVESVKQQTIRQQPIKQVDVRRAMGELVMDDSQLEQIGEALSAGLGFFLFGASGNGKTSIAERVTQAFGDTIWIPRTLQVGGQVVRLFDPGVHQVAPWTEQELGVAAEHVDHRWIRIRRPTIVVGGELKLEQLDIHEKTGEGVCEAPLQLKSNGGTLVIDDFGRQQFRPSDLMNRWIVPLERRVDYLTLPNGRTVEVPFDQLIIFSTNMNPYELVDEAFLRRIPYKIEATSPSDEQFRKVFSTVAKKVGLEFRPIDLDYLLQRHYQTTGRPLRFCHARDIVHQIYHYCTFRELPLVVTRIALDASVKNYFLNTQS